MNNSSNQQLRKTPLYDWHLANHANMAEFGGYLMPLWYRSGAKQEHLSVIREAGMFDTSHMSTLIVQGSGSFNLLQKCFTKDLTRCLAGSSAPLSKGHSVYGIFLRDDGTVLDDAIVSMLGEDHYMIVVNSSMGDAVSTHLKNYSEAGVEIIDFSGQLGKIDLQGKLSARVLEPLLENPERTFDGMGYFSFKGDIFSTERSRVIVGGIPALLSRTGYTGEFGFELFVAAEHTLELWELLLAAGESYKLQSCGLAARDSLRAGALLPLSHQDIGDWLFSNTPWSFVLPWTSDQTAFAKHFVGAEPLLTGNDTSYTYGYAGYDPRKVSSPQDTVVLDDSGDQIGTVLTCTTDMAVGRVEDRIVSVATTVENGRPENFKARGLCCGFIKTSRPCGKGEQLFLSEGKRHLKIEIRDNVRPDRTARRPIQQMRSIE